MHLHSNRDSMAEPSVPIPNISNTPESWPLDVVDVDLLLAGAVSLVRRVRVAVLVELEANALVSLVAVCVGLVDLCVLGELAVGF